MPDHDLFLGLVIGLAMVNFVLIVIGPINLRSDLARLSDSDLGAEFNRLCEYRVARFGSAPAVGSLRGAFRYGRVPAGRGPIFARWTYRLQIGYFWIFRGPVGTQYLVECEIEDLRDEMMRRIQKRKQLSNPSS
jgi:hypothetical protein